MRCDNTTPPTRSLHPSPSRLCPPPAPRASALPQRRIHRPPAHPIAVRGVTGWRWWNGVEWGGMRWGCGCLTPDSSSRPRGRQPDDENEAGKKNQKTKKQQHRITCTNQHAISASSKTRIFTQSSRGVVQGTAWENGLKYCDKVEGAAPRPGPPRWPARGLNQVRKREINIGLQSVNQPATHMGAISSAQRAARAG